MKIEQVGIENFKSIYSVELSDLPNLVILIGKNSSGKSNVIDALALLFAEFGAEVDRDLGDLATFQHLFSHYTLQPDRVPAINAIMTFTAEEWSNILSVDLNVARKFEDTRLFVEKALVVNEMRVHWMTLSIYLGESIIVSDGNIESDNLSVFPNSLADMEFEPVEIISNELIGRLAELLKSNFQVILTTENHRSWLDKFLPRPTIIDDEHHRSLWEASQSSGNSRLSWTRLARQFERISANEQRPVGVASSIQMEEGALTVPIGMTGEGSQATLRLIDQLERTSEIVAIEEPETHLHPGRIKQIGEFLKYKTGRGKQIFVCTHSPFLVDQSALSNVFVVKKDGSETNVASLGNTEDLRTMLVDIGMRPSDILFSNAILLVEGPSDEIFLNGLSNVIERPLVETYTKIIGVGGYPRGKRKIEFWAEVGKEAGLPLYLILDKDAESEADSAVNKNLISRERCLILQNGNLEDCYPLHLLEKAVSNLFDISIDNSTATANRVAEIKKKLSSKGKRNEWKPLLAEEILRTITRADIESEMRDIADFVRKIDREVGEN